MTRSVIASCLLFIRRRPTIAVPASSDASSSSRAFAALLPELHRSARRLSGSPEDADDLVQETLLRVWSRIAMGAQGASDAAPVDDLRAYAFATLRNAAKRRPAVPTRVSDDLIEDVPDLPDAAPAHLACSDALTALNALPADQADLLKMRALDGHSYAEIARRTGLPMGTVTSRLARGRAALREALGLPQGAPVRHLFQRD